MCARERGAPTAQGRHRGPRRPVAQSSLTRQRTQRAGRGPLLHAVLLYCVSALGVKGLGTSTPQAPFPPIPRLSPQPEPRPAKSSSRTCRRILALRPAPSLPAPVFQKKRTNCETRTGRPGCVGVGRRRAQEENQILPFDWLDLVRPPFCRETAGSETQAEKEGEGMSK